MQRPRVPSGRSQSRLLSVGARVIEEGKASCPETERALPAINIRSAHANTLKTMVVLNGRNRRRGLKRRAETDSWGIPRSKNKEHVASRHAQIDSMQFTTKRRPLQRGTRSRVGLFTSRHLKKVRRGIRQVVRAMQRCNGPVFCATLFATDSDVR